MIKFYALVKRLPLNRQAFTILGLLLSSGTAFSQNVGINGTGNAPHSSAGLDVSFTDKGLLIPRVKLKSSRDTQTISSPEVSLLVYNTETVEDVTPGYYYYDGSVWQRLAANSASSNWSFANGNAYFSGNLGIGVSNPAYRLHIDGANNPLFLRRVQQGTTSDSILTIAEGIVRKLPFASVNSPSPWATSGSDISFSSGNVGIGTTTSPTSRLQVEANANPLNLKGVVAGTNTDEILTITTGGVVRKLAQRNLAGSSQWTTSSSNISYTVGNVGIGIAAPTHGLHVRSVADPILLEGIQEGSPSDSILTISDGVVRRLLYKTVSPWSPSGVSIVYNDSIGNVGIGTLDPQYKLSVQSSENPLFLSGVKQGLTSDSILTISNGVVKSLPPTGLLQTSWALNGNAISSSNFIGTTNNQPLKFKTLNNQRLSIESDGSIGIGVAPGFSSGNEREKVLIDVGQIASAVSNTSGTTALAIKGNTNNFIQFNIQNTSTSGKASTDIVATSNLTGNENYIDLGINGAGNTQDKWGAKSDGYLFVNNGELLIGTNTDKKSIYFLAGADKKSNPQMVISGKTGTVSIGVDSANTDDKLIVNGSALATRWGEYSDRRLKKDIQPLDYGLKSLVQLQPVTYKWIDPKQSSQTQIGLIAQDAKKVIPEIVQGDEAKEKLSINYTELIPVLINAIKEQQQKIDSQQKQIDELRELIKQK